MQVGAAVFDGPRADGEGQPSDGRGGNTTATGRAQRWTVLALNLVADRPSMPVPRQGKHRT